MNRLAFLLVSVVALLGLTSCGSTPASTAVTCTTNTNSSSTSTTTSTCTDPVTNISLTISPSTLSINVVTAQQFTGILSGNTNNVIIWKVNNETGGDDKVGRIDSNGLYHAPGTVPSTNPVSVTATSFEDQNLTATATVTILSAPTVKITSPTGPVTVTSGNANTVTFSATESGGTANAVFWEVGPVGGIGIQGGNSNFGTIDANGVYTAPLTPPIGSVVQVTAVAQDNSTSTASVNVTISGYSTSSLKGQFEFSVSGSIASGPAAGPFYRAGSFAADGAGNLTGGLEDINEISRVTTGISFFGSYTVTSDGRGTLNFNDPHGSVTTPAIFDFVLMNGGQIQITGFDNSKTTTPSYPGTAFGQANAQIASSFAGNPLTALLGTYIFDFTGVVGANSLSMVGEFQADGAGQITGGAIDINDGGASSTIQISGSGKSTYTVGTNGQGTATIATSDSNFSPLHFNFYVVSQGSAKFVGTDTARAVGGMALQQNSTVGFNTSTLNGNFAFLLAGTGAGGPYTSAGSFLTDGNGGITRVFLDENSNGTPSANMTLSGTTYTVSSNGRGTLDFIGGRTYVFYLGSAGSGFLQETDSTHGSVVIDGVLAAQQNAAFALSQIAGTNAVATNGLSSSGEVVSGNFTTSATTPGTIPSGTLDVNDAGTVNLGVPVTSGSYAASSSAERGTMTLTLGNPVSQARNYAVYVVSPTQAFLVDIDTGHLGAGQLLRQF